MRQVVLLLTYGADSALCSKLAHLMDAVSETTDCHVLFHRKPEYDSADILKKLQSITKVHVFTDSILTNLGYFAMGNSLIPGNAHFPLLDYYRICPTYDFYWVVEDDVIFNGSWTSLFDYYHDKKTDLVASYISHYHDEIHWPWWSSLYTSNYHIEISQCMKAFCPIYRISRRALIGLHELMSDGWRGHAEVVIPTAVNYHKYSMADMGVVEENAIRQKVFYNKQTMSHLKLTVNVELADMLYHPIKNPPYS